MRHRLLAAGLGLVILVAGALGAAGAPRMTLLNTGLRIEYPWARGLGALGVALGLGLIALALPRRWMRWIAAVAAVVATAFALGRLAYRLDAGDGGVVDRGLLGATRLAWRDVRRVDTGPALILIWGPGDAQVRVDTSSFSPEQRATLERTIARRVREAQPPAPH